MSAVSFAIEAGRLIDLYENERVAHALDPTRVLLERLQLVPGERVLEVGTKAENADALGDIPDASFDVVYLNTVAHWLPRRPEPLLQFHRVLAAGGRFGITACAGERRGTLQAARNAVLARAPYASFPEPKRAQRVTMVELQDLLLRAGFAVSSLEIVSSITLRATPNAAIEAAEAVSFADFLGHLPEELRTSARAEIARELEAFRGRDGIRLEGSRIIAVAHRLGRWAD